MKRNYLFVLFVLVGFIVPQFVFAAGTVTPGSEIVQDDSGDANDTISANLNFAIWAEAGRSYSCTVLGGSTLSQLGFSDNASLPDATIFTPGKCGDVTPAVATAAPSIDAAQDDNRICFTATQTGLHTFTVNKFSAGEPRQVECSETTLYGVYNTNVNDFNFLELTNLTNSSLEIAWKAVNFDGTEFTGTATIAANRRADIDLHSEVGDGKFGFVQVTHNGPRGALIGAVSQYSGTVSDFSLSVSIPLKERVNNK